jgi:hypothetical protein
MKKILFLCLLLGQVAWAENAESVFQTIRFKGLNSVDLILELDEDAKQCGLNKAELLKSVNYLMNQSRVIKVDTQAEDYIALNITTLPTNYEEAQTSSCFFVSQIELNRLINFKDKRIYASLWENSILNYSGSSSGALEETGSTKKMSAKKISNEKLIESTLQKLVSTFLNEIENSNH